MSGEPAGPRSTRLQGRGRSGVGVCATSQWARPRSRTPRRRRTTLFTPRFSSAFQLLSSNVVNDLVLLESMMDNMTGRQKDPRTTVRMLALRGLGNIASGSPEKVGAARGGASPGPQPPAVLGAHCSQRQVPALGPEVWLVTDPSVLVGRVKAAPGYGQRLGQALLGCAGPPLKPRLLAASCTNRFTEPPILSCDGGWLWGGRWVAVGLSRCGCSSLLHLLAS